MKTVIKAILRSGSKGVRRVVPEHVHARLRLTAHAGIRECRRAVNGVFRIVSGRWAEKKPSFFHLIPTAATSVDGVLNGTDPQGNNQPTTARGNIKRDDIVLPTEAFVGCGNLSLEGGRDFLLMLEKQRQDAEIVFCCAFMGRHRVLKQNIEESLAGEFGEKVRWMLVGSTTDDLQFIQAMAKLTGQVAGCVVENTPLGRKWQSCMKFAFHYFDAALYTIIGSDDMISHTLVDNVVERHRKNLSNTSKSGEEYLPAMYCVLEWMVIHNNPDSSMVPQIFKCSYHYDTAFQPLGAGRFYTRQFIEECDGIVFDSPLDRLLDDRGYFEARDRGRSLEYFTVEDGPLISIKGDWSQMNQISDFMSATTLTMTEFSFAGRALLNRTISSNAYQFLFKERPISRQFH